MTLVSSLAFLTLSDPPVLHSKQCVIFNLPLTGCPKACCQQKDRFLFFHPPSPPAPHSPVKSRAHFELEQIHIFLPYHPFFIYFSPSALSPSFIASPLCPANDRDFTVCQSHARFRPLHYYCFHLHSSFRFTWARGFNCSTHVNHVYSRRYPDTEGLTMTQLVSNTNIELV